MGSILFPGTTTSTLTIANDADIRLGTGDFTVEWFQYRTDSNAAARPFSIGRYSTATFAVSLEGSTLYLWVLSSFRLSASIGAHKNVWIHFAVCRSGNVFSVYKDGTRIGTYTGTHDINDSSTPLTVGNEYSPSNAAGSFGGNITNFHWVKGTALYSGATCVVPTAPITPVSNTKILLKATTSGGLLTDSSASPKTVVNTSTTWSAMTPFVVIVPPPAPVIPAVLRTQGMPPQFYPSAGDTLFAMNRASYLRTAGFVGALNNDYNELLNKKTKVYRSNDSSSFVQSKRIQAIGYSSTHIPALGANAGDHISFKNPDNQVQKDALRRCRSGGSVAPAKKGANSAFKSGR
jgi:hypothetical protein